MKNRSNFSLESEAKIRMQLCNNAKMTIFTYLKYLISIHKRLRVQDKDSLQVNNDLVCLKYECSGHGDILGVQELVTSLGSDSAVFITHLLTSYHHHCGRLQRFGSTYTLILIYLADDCCFALCSTVFTEIKDSKSPSDYL